MCAITAFSQDSYITATGTVSLESGGVKRYYDPVIFVSGTYDVRPQTWLIKLSVSSGGVSAKMPISDDFYLRFTKTEINAYTGTGTGDTEKIQNALEQAVVDYLEALNPSATIVIN